MRKSKIELTNEEANRLVLDELERSSHKDGYELGEYLSLRTTCVEGKCIYELLGTSVFGSQKRKFIYRIPYTKYHDLLSDALIERGYDVSLVCEVGKSLEDLAYFVHLKNVKSKKRKTKKPDSGFAYRKTKY